MRVRAATTAGNVLNVRVRELLIIPSGRGFGSLFFSRVPFPFLLPWRFSFLNNSEAESLLALLS